MPRVELRDAPARILGGLSDLVGSEHVLVGEGLSRYRIGAATPTLVVFPADEAQVSQILGVASAEGLAVVPWGGGLHQAIGHRPGRYEVALDLGRMGRLLEHEPGDMTATAQAGIRLGELQRSLGAQGQFLSLDPPLAEGATLGGVLATNLSGPWRCRYGTARDLVLGVRVAHADGTITKGGAKVVKNATAYDITKLYLGSHGTLGVILEATVRLYPCPAVEQGWRLDLPDLDRGQALAGGILGTYLTSNRVELLDGRARRIVGGDERGVTLLVSCAGVPEAVRQHGEVVSQLAADAGAGLAELGGAEETWRALRDFPWRGIPEGETGYRALFRASVLPADCAKAMHAVREATGGLADVAVAATVAAGALRGECRAETADGLLRALLGAREALSGVGGFLVVLDAPEPVRAEMDEWGRLPDGLTVMQRLKTAFDPQGILNPGRFVAQI